MTKTSNSDQLPCRMPKGFASRVSVPSSEASSISPKGSDLLTWEAGHSTLLVSLTIGLLNCSGFAVSIRPREPPRLTNISRASTRKTASTWQQLWRKCCWKVQVVMLSNAACDQTASFDMHGGLVFLLSLREASRVSLAPQWM